MASSDNLELPLSTPDEVHGVPDKDRYDYRQSGHQRYSQVHVYVDEQLTARVSLIIYGFVQDELNYS